LNTACSQQFINDNLTQATRNKLNKIYVLKTGQTTSFRTRDDGDLQLGRLGFGVLPLNNSFGNTNRFTDDIGGQTYAAAYAIDHGTGNGWCLTLRAAATWNTAIDRWATFSLTVGATTYSDFFLPSIAQVKSLVNYGTSSGYLMNYAPFNYMGAGIWTSTTFALITTSAMVYQQVNINLERATDKGQFFNYYLARIHF
jgi:hypothetical protein